MVSENSFVAVLIRIFFLLTPFFVLSMFVAMTLNMDRTQCNNIALKILLANLVICLPLYFFGAQLFYFLGITLDAFRIGAGAILFITAYEMVTGKNPALPVKPPGIQMFMTAILLHGQTAAPEICIHLSPVIVASLIH